jgi:hypothetical protein
MHSRGVSLFAPLFATQLWDWPESGNAVFSSFIGKMRQLHKKFIA